MQVIAPSGRDYAVRRRWLPWRQRVPLDTMLLVTVVAAVELVLRVAVAPLLLVLRLLHLAPWEIEVRDLGARREAAVVSRHRVRGWDASQRRMRELVSELLHQHVAPAPSGFEVVLTRDPVSMGDVDDTTRVIVLDDRTAHPTLATLLTAVARGGRWVHVGATPTTWVLREGDVRRGRGRPLAVLVLHAQRESPDVHPVGDTSFRVARDGRFHLEHLGHQDVGHVLELIARDPSGRRPLRAKDQA